MENKELVEIATTSLASLWDQETEKRQTSDSPQAKRRRVHECGVEKLAELIAVQLRQSRAKASLTTEDYRRLKDAGAI